MGDIEYWIITYTNIVLSPFREITSANNALAKYGAGRWNFIISNIAGSVWSWTADKLA
jgi:hypothetical protein